MALMRLPFKGGLRSIAVCVIGVGSWCTSLLASDPLASIAFVSLPVGTIWPITPFDACPPDTVPACRVQQVTLSGDGRIVLLVVQRGADVEAYSWSEALGYQPLELPPETQMAWLVSSSFDGAVVAGAFVGESQTGAPRAAVWVNGGLQSLVTPGGPVHGCASALTRDGSVAFGVHDTPSGRSVFRWSLADGVADMPSPDPGAAAIVGCSGDGSVLVGGPVCCSSGADSFSWTASSGATYYPNQMFSGISRDGQHIVSIFTSVSADGRSKCQPGGTGNCDGRTDILVWREGDSASGFGLDEFREPTLTELLLRQGWAPQDVAPLGVFASRIGLSDSGAIMAGAVPLSVASTPAFWIARVPSPNETRAGACCSGVTCVVTGAVADCEALGGLFQGIGSACNAGPRNPIACCRANLDGVAGLTVQDIFRFLEMYFDPARTSLDGRRINFSSFPWDHCGISVEDIFAFLQAWFAGCD